MSDINLPGDEPSKAVQETAKFGQSVATLAKAGGEWASAVLGTLPHDAVGILADQVRAYRIERAYALRARMIERLRQKGFEEPEKLTAPPALLLPILNAAVDEDRQALQDLWEKLLVAASDPNRKNKVRHSFIETLKQLDPADALLLQSATHWTKYYQFRESAHGSTGLDLDEVDLSLQRLKDMKLIDGRGMASKSGHQETSGYQLSIYGRSFLAAVAD